MTSPRLPPDPALPQLSRVLDLDEMTSVLQRSFGEIPIAGVRVGAVHYQPRTRLVVRYEVRVGHAVHEAVGMISSSGKLARLAALPGNRALAHVAAARAPVAAPLVYEPGLDYLLQWLPLDIRLPALAEPTDLLRERLRAAGVGTRARGGNPSLLSYRPRRHAALRLGRHVLKVYATDPAFETAASALRFSSAVRAIRTPRFEAVVPELRLTVQSFLPGRRQTDGAALAARAGALLSSLHGTAVHGLPVDGLPVASPAGQLERAARKARFLAVIAPELGDPLQKLVERLAATTPNTRSLVPSHGDFSVRQLLEARAGLAVVDLDGVCLAPRALDVASYAARLVRGQTVELEPALAGVDALISGYGRRPAALPWYLSTSILIRADTHFVHPQENWLGRVTAMVGVAESALRT